MLVEMAGDESQEDQARLDALFGLLRIPNDVHESLRLRIEPLARFQDDVRPGEHTPTYGVFVMYRPNSVLNGEADVTHLVDLPTCMAVRRACSARGIYVVDNTGLPSVRKGALKEPSSRPARRAARRRS
jgi:hypothetical protein